MKHLLLLLLVCGFSFIWGDAPPPVIDPFSLQEPPPPEMAQDNRFLNEFFYMLFMLAILIGVVLLASWFLKRMLHTRIEQLNTQSQIKIVDKRALSQKTIIYLIEYEDQKFMVAETPTSLVTIMSEKT